MAWKRIWTLLGRFSSNRDSCQLYRQELKPYGIKCSLLEPGIFKTPLLDKKAQENRVNYVWNNLSNEIREEYGEEYKEGCKFSPDPKNVEQSLS